MLKCGRELSTIALPASVGAFLVATTECERVWLSHGWIRRGGFKGSRFGSTWTTYRRRIENLMAGPCRGWCTTLSRWRSIVALTRSFRVCFETATWCLFSVRLSGIIVEGRRSIQGAKTLTPSCCLCGRERTGERWKISSIKVITVFFTWLFG